MLIPLLDKSLVRRGKKEVSGRFTEYDNAIAEHIPWLKEQIGKSKDGNIYIRYDDMVTSLGPQFKYRSLWAMALGLKFALFDEGIAVRTSSIKGHDDLFILRYRNEKDSLPESWQEIYKKKSAKSNNKTGGEIE